MSEQLKLSSVKAWPCITSQQFRKRKQKTVLYSTEIIENETRGFYIYIKSICKNVGSISLAQYWEKIYINWSRKEHGLCLGETTWEGVTKNLISNCLIYISLEQWCSAWKKHLWKLNNKITCWPKNASNNVNVAEGFTKSTMCKARDAAYALSW